MSSSFSAAPNNLGHEKFVELCAVYTSGSLTSDECEKLKHHLTGCPQCRIMLADYHSLVHEHVPVLAAAANFEPARGFDTELANGKKALFARLDQNEIGNCRNLRTDWKHHPLSASRVYVGSVVRYGAMLLLGTGLGFSAFVFHNRNSEQVPSSIEQNQIHGLKAEVSRVSEQRDSLQQQ